MLKGRVRFVASKELRNQCCVFLLIEKVMVMKGLPCAEFWISNSVYTGYFVYPSSFGYQA